MEEEKTSSSDAHAHQTESVTPSFTAEDAKMKTTKEGENQELEKAE